MAGPHADSEAEVVGRHDHADPLAGRKLHVTVVTPQGSVLSTTADEVTAPGVLGEFGILPGHIPFLTALRAGVLSIKTGGTRDIYAVAGGHAQVGAGDQVRILVSRAEKAGAVDIETARSEATSLADELKSASTTADDTAEKRARLDWARARVDAHDRETGGGGGKDKH